MRLDMILSGIMHLSFIYVSSLLINSINQEYDISFLIMILISQSWPASENQLNYYLVLKK